MDFSLKRIDLIKKPIHKILREILFVSHAGTNLVVIEQGHKKRGASRRDPLLIISVTKTDLNHGK